VDDNWPLQEREAFAFNPATNLATTLKTPGAAAVPVETLGNGAISHIYKLDLSADCRAEVPPYTHTVLFYLYSPSLRPLPNLAPKRNLAAPGPSLLTAAFHIAGRSTHVTHLAGCNKIGYHGVNNRKINHEKEMDVPRGKGATFAIDLDAEGEWAGAAVLL
jgi:hypothetical protein